MNRKDQLLEALVSALELAPHYYEKAHSRYADLGAWFCRPDAVTAPYSPRIYGQGSFRLGTVIRPIFQNESYDLDVGCRLENGVTKRSHTQEQLKSLVGRELQSYRTARQIAQTLQEKHRCWRLEYADELAFHMDVVPSIPEGQIEKAILTEAIARRGLDRFLAETVASHSGNITDNRLPNYRLVDDDWKVSNSEGYAKWFESRIVLAREEVRRIEATHRARVDKLPAWKWKAPLQKAVQLLKRHRDCLFVDAADAKPISIILTTLAGEAYRGEETTSGALERILGDMDRYVQPQEPRVPNPVNPLEDFADKWRQHELRLEENFHLWLGQARADFKHLERLATEEAVDQFMEEKFRVRIPREELGKILLPAVGLTPDYRSVQIITQSPPRPWRR